jgi:hypothetical protein
VVGKLGWCLHLKLQQLLLKVGDHLYPHLKLSVLRLHMVLKVHNPVVRVSTSSWVMSSSMWV